ncbi:phosphoesterase [Methanocalculus taiwanensis]|uniref:Phosphoesterase n=2 Tax=Methanocalculus taiwanensis TaxID=106207 RepID=A0ABD4TH61_9EURY|nr:phosphoesterase [Methanocalculus taiwanensis]
MDSMPPSPEGTPRPLRFIHTADLHLGSRVMGVTGMNDDTRRDLALATYQSWKKIVDLCIQEKVDFLLIAGDTYDSTDNNIRAQLQFREGLVRLGQNGIPAYIVHGNHDPYNSWSRSIALPENAVVFSHTAPEHVIHRDGSGVPLAAIVGMSFPTAHVKENLARKFPDREADWPYTIGLLHCSVGSSMGHEPYAPCAAEDLTRCGYDYWALGHIHKPTEISSSDCPFIYPGNPQGRDSSETGERGCLLVTVAADGETAMQFLPTAQFQWKEMAVDISGTDDIGMLEEQIRGELLSAVGETGTPVISRIVLTGATTLHSALAAGDGVTAIMEQLNDDPPSGRHPAFAERIICQTLPRIDRGEVQSREDILGEICRIGDRARTEGQMREVLNDIISPLYLRSEAKSHLNLPEEDEIKAIMSEAESLLLSKLMEGGSA